MGGKRSQANRRAVRGTRSSSSGSSESSVDRSPSPPPVKVCMYRYIYTPYCIEGKLSSVQILVYSETSYKGHFRDQPFCPL